jgi:hypothetical protein
VEVVEDDHAPALPVTAVGEDAGVVGVQDLPGAPAELGQLLAGADGPLGPVEQRPRVAALGGHVHVLGRERAVGDHRHGRLPGGEAAVGAGGPLHGHPDGAAALHGLVVTEADLVLEALGLGAGLLDHERGGVDPEAGKAQLSQ